MATLAITNASTILSGDLGQPVIAGADTVICRDGTIAAIGTGRALADQIQAAERVVDAHGSTVAPGLIDSHCHVVLGDYTPRQKTVDFLDSYVHGGITSVVSARTAPPATMQASTIQPAKRFSMPDLPRLLRA